MGYVFLKKYVVLPKILFSNYVIINERPVGTVGVGSRMS